MKRLIFAAIALGMPGVASAELVATSDSGFVSRHSADTQASPAQVYAMLGKPASWWVGEHSYSGNAANLTLEPKAGACFCETLPASGGSVEHGRVIHADPGKRLRLTGGLGPLQREAVVGTLDFTIEARSGGGSTVTLTYVVGGYSRNALSVLAKPVDTVISQQFASLTRALAVP